MFDADFAAGRAAILRDLLGRPALFRTSLARELWERPARADVAAEIERLGGTVRVWLFGDAARRRRAG